VKKTFISRARLRVLPRTRRFLRHLFFRGKDYAQLGRTPPPRDDGHSHHNVVSRGHQF